MKTSFSFLSAIIFSIILSGCIKDSCKDAYHYKIYTPVYHTMESLRAQVKTEGATDLNHPGKIYCKGGYLFVNESEEGIHIINDKDPSHPQNISFINIPGNIDMAVKGNFLYADSYLDMLVFDISDPANVKLVTRLNNIFPRSFYSGVNTPDQELITTYTERDTVISSNCKNNMGNVFYGNNTDVFFLSASQSAPSSFASMAATSGIAGSMSRFAVMNSYLYTVNDNSLTLFNINTPSDPEMQKSISVGQWVETIFPYQNHLFIGSQIGMFIYDASNPSDPVKVGQMLHMVQSCDPVVAQGNTAYCTLRTGDGSVCHEGVNQLISIDLSDIKNPKEIKEYNMNNPHGLAILNDHLLVCDGVYGLNVMNAAKADSIYSVQSIDNTYTEDVIALQNFCIVVGKDGLYQYDYNNWNKLQLISKIPCKNS